MKKILYATISTLIYSTIALAQLEGNGILNLNSSNYLPITMVDRQGTSLKRFIIEQATGTPYYNDAWLTADVVTTNGTQFKNIQLKVHLQSNEFHYKNEQGQIVIVAPGVIKYATVYNPLLDTAQFITLLPSIYKNTSSTIYKVITQGKYTLLSHIEKLYRQSKNQLSGEQNNEFLTYTNHYALINNILTPLISKKDIKNLSDIILKEDLKKYNNYTNSNSISNIKDVELLFKALN